MKHICGNRDVPHLDEVRPHQNVERLLVAVPIQLKASEEGDVVGIVLDADTEIKTRWSSIRNTLIGIGYDSVPDQPKADGTILDSPAGTLLPRAGVWLMPDNQANGILEDFLAFLVPQPSDLFDHVQESVATIPGLLEPQKEPGMPLGAAISARFLDANVSEVDVLVAWLMRLFFSR